jgi:hypothetical protein
LETIVGSCRDEFFGKNTQYQDQGGMIFFEKHPIPRPGWYDLKKKNQ